MRFFTLVYAMFAILTMGHVHGQEASLQIPADFNGVIFHADSRADVGHFTAYGLPDFAKTHTFNPDTRFQVGSVSKFFTALLVLRLVDQQRLALDKPIGAYLDDLPKSTANTVTLRHLLSNASGIPDGATAALRTDPSIRKSTISTHEAYVQWAQAPLAFEPGNGWDYSVTNWILIRAVLERTSALSFETLIQRELITPLGLTNTGIPSQSFPFSQHDAKSYSSSQAPQEQQSLIPQFAAASGSFYSSVHDLRIIMDSLSHAEYLSAASQQELLKVNVAAENYALGGRIMQENNQATLWLPGKTSNYRALIAYRVTDGNYTVALNNTGVDQSVLTAIINRVRKSP